ncbi:hypothetical protein DY000_02008979, partial [Brassica cretica]
VQSSGSSILSLASEEGATWLNLQLIPPESSLVITLIAPQTRKWMKPPMGTVKCNVASLWVDSFQNSGSTWILRDSSGVPRAHSRWAFAPITSALEAELQTLWWALEALHDIHVKRVIFEVSSDALMEAMFSPTSPSPLSYGISRILRSLHLFDHCQVVSSHRETNFIALQVAESVTRDQRLQPYMATVNDLFDGQGGGWDIQRVRDVIHEEDVELVLNTGFNLSEQDRRIWGFSKNGVYNSKSGYKLAETLELQQDPPGPSLPPIEKRLWQDLWKTKTTPKIRHFMWRALSGALAVKQGLRSRGILLAELQTLWWAMEALHDIHVKRVIFEVSSDALMEAVFSPTSPSPLSYGISRILRSLHLFDHCQVVSSHRETNFIALQVAESVTRDQILQSYMAMGGPSWLSFSVTTEALNAGPY